MKTTDRTILLSLAGVGLLAAIWMLAISPRRAELTELDRQAAALESSVATLESEASAGEAARAEFPGNYSRMVVLGKAVPSGHEESDLIVGLDRIGEQAGVDFQSISLNEGAGGVEAAAPLTQQTQTDQAPPADPAAGGDPAATTALAAPTETAASTLPLGASIGPAGLGVMAWDVKFVGDFFDINSVLAAVDRAVRFEQDRSRARGRLVTVDGFHLSMANSATKPELNADMAIRSYITPDDQGVTLGANPAGPSNVPASSEVTP